MKRINYKSNIISAFFALMMLSFINCIVSCGSSDGDAEEIHFIDYDGPTDNTQDNPLRKKLIGTWTIHCVRHVQGYGNRGVIYNKWKEGTKLTFNDDGTYDDTSRNGSYKWDAQPDKEQNLKLDGKDFHYDDEGGNAEVTCYDGEDIWLFCWVRGDVPVPSDQDPTPEPTKTYEYRVSKIVKTIPGSDANNIYQFTYDDKGRISTFTKGYESSASYGGSGSGGRGDKGEPSYGGDKIGDWINWIYVYPDNYTVELYRESQNNFIATAYLDSNGLISTVSGNNFYASYSYDNYGSYNRPSLINYKYGTSSISSKYVLSYSSDDLQRIAFNSNYSADYTCSREENNSNICLNWFLCSFFQSLHDEIYLAEFAPFGFCGRCRYLISSENYSYTSTSFDYPTWNYSNNNFTIQRDSNNLITQIRWSGSSYYHDILSCQLDIYYDKYEVKD